MYFKQNQQALKSDSDWTFSKARLSAALLCVMAFFLVIMNGYAQSPNSIQIPYINTAIGIPAGSTETVCATALPLSTLVSGSLTVHVNTGDACPANQAILSNPQSVYIDPNTDNIYIADYGHNQEREVYNSGSNAVAQIVNTVNSAATLTTGSVKAGNIYNACGPYISALGGGPYRCSQVTLPVWAQTVDSSSTIIMSINLGNIRMAYAGGAQALNLLKMTAAKYAALPTPYPGQEINIVPGTYAGYYGDGGSAVSGMLNAARGIVLDANYDLYIADSGNNAIRVINGTTGYLSTIAGSSCVPAAGMAFGPIVSPYTQAVPVTAPKTQGGCAAGSSGDDGPATSALLNKPYDVLFDASGNLYIADSGNKKVRVIYNGKGSIPGVTSPVTGYIYTVAGGGTLTTGGPALQMAFGTIQGLGFDANGNLYLADASENKIWEIDATTQVATAIAGGGASSGIGTPCSTSFLNGPKKTFADGDGCLASLATLSGPTGRISFDSKGNLYVADSGNNVIRIISHEVLPAATTPIGSEAPVALGFAPLSAVTLAPSGFTDQGIANGADFQDGGGSTCSSGVLTAGQICYVNALFKPNMPGLREGGAQIFSVLNKVIGSNFLSGTGTGAAIALDDPMKSTIGSGLTPAGVASDPSGAVYVADAKSGNLLKYASATATTPATVMSGLKSPSEVYVDGLGSVYVADTGNNRIGIYNNNNGTVSYLTGYASPQGVAVDGSGNLYIADTGNNRVIQIASDGSSTVLATSVSAPTQLSFDGEGNLYIIDTGNNRAVELPGGTGAQANVSLGVFDPIAIATDAAGDFYVLDKTGSQLGLISAAGATTTTPLTGLITPSGLSVDSLGDVYVADAGTGQVTLLNRQHITTNFYPVSVGKSSTFSSFTLTNIGNSPLTFSGSVPYTASGATAEFNISSSTTNGCTGSPLAPGIGCNLSAVFSSAVLGNFTDTLTFPSNASNATIATSALVGTASNLMSSNLSITSLPGASAPIAYGTPITLNFTLTENETTAATGNIVLQINGFPVVTLPVKNGAATYTLAPSAGTITVAGQYPGDANYDSSFAALTFTILPAATTTKLTYSGVGLSIPADVQGKQAPVYTLSATVTTPAAGLTGIVSFSVGSTVLGMSSLNAEGVATLTISNTPASNFALNNPSFTASYLGGDNFASSTSSAVLVQGDFGMSALGTTLSTVQGAVISTPLSITPYFGISGNVTFACSNLPLNAGCRFLPYVATFTGSSSDPIATVSLEVYSNVPTNLAKRREQLPFGRHSTEIERIAFTTFGGLVFFTWCKRRIRIARKLFLVLLLVFMPMVVSLGVTGCSGGNYYNYPVLITPPGSTVVTVTGTTPGGISESIPVTVVIGASN
jgi:sugar lactone lactonase YvrE